MQSPHSVAGWVPNCPPGALDSHAAHLRDCISVLFMFIRRPVVNHKFSEDCQHWLDILVGESCTLNFEPSMEESKICVVASMMNSSHLIRITSNLANFQNEITITLDCTFCPPFLFVPPSVPSATLILPPQTFIVHLVIECCLIPALVEITPIPMSVCSDDFLVLIFMLPKADSHFHRQVC